MNSKMLSLSLAILIASQCTTTAWADTAAEMLEKAIYNEETVGNLDEAIKIYRQVVSTADETERIAANAQYRLGQCLLKQNKKTEAMQAFQSLVDHYPQQTEFVEKARQHLPGKLELTEAPWQAGERLTLEMRLPGGQPIGVIGTGIESGELDNKPVWKMAIRRFVGGSHNEGVSFVAVDQATNFPIHTKWDHTMLGQATGKWSREQLEVSLVKKIGEAAETRTVELDRPAYANDQWFFGFRQLPLKIGYRTTLPIRVAFTGGNPIDMEVEVKKKEKVTTPAGEFDCFRLDTNIAQTFWVADVPQRYLVKFVAGGVDAVLTSITESNEVRKLKHDGLGCELELPSGWFQFQPEADNPREATFVLVSPRMPYAVVSIKEIQQLKKQDRESVEAWAESKIARGKRVQRNFAVRAGSKQPTKIAGADGLMFVVDHDQGGAPFVSEISLALTKKHSIAIQAETRQGGLKALQPALQTLRESITVE